MTGMPNDESKDGLGEVEIYSSDEDRVKLLGETLGNDSSRCILLLLTRTEMTASEIVANTDLSLSLVIHHLEKMQKAGIVHVSRVVKNSRNHDMKYYCAASAILVFPKEAYGKAKESKSLALSLRQIMKFSAIGVAGLSSWLVARYLSPAGVVWQSAEDPNMQAAEPLAPILVGMGIVMIGLIVERIIVALKK